MGTVVDPAFRNVPKDEPCLRIWRIEKLKVVAISEKEYGNFFTGDSYIVYQSKLVQGRIEMHIHFWLGEESTQDEMGVAAYKSVELDDSLGGAPIQHRETQGNESKQFLEIFRQKGGVRYKQGGVASGFNHVDKTFKPYLLQIKGKRTARVKERNISWDSMNEGDVFILDVGTVLFVWTGRDSNRFEKIKGMEVARQLRDERGKGDIVAVADGEEEKLNFEWLKVFEKHLPLDKKQVKSAAEGGADEVHERASMTKIKLYLVKEENDQLNIKELKEGPLVKSDLDPDDSFIVDNGEAGIWVWNGKQSSKRERSEAMTNAMAFITEKKYPQSTRVTRVVEGGEPVMFKQLFKSWPEPQADLKSTTVINQIAKIEQTKFDASSLHNGKKKETRDKSMVDDGSGKVEVWRIEGNDMVAVPNSQLGRFFGGDCYVILYTYGDEKHIIYFWLGNKSALAEQGASAIRSVHLDDKFGGEPVQVRVVQGKEPPHFMAVFKGKIIIFEGGSAREVGDYNKVAPGSSFLLQVRSTNEDNVKAVEVPCRAASLNSNDVFILYKNESLILWCGRGSNASENRVAKQIARSLTSKPPTILNEGNESDVFWKAVGGRESYASDRRLQEEAPPREPRLFQCSNASGKFLVEDIPDFIQQDLVPDDVMILDTFDTIFIWIGEGANKQEKELAMQTAVEYIKTDPAGRDPDTPIAMVKQGFEPPNFTGFFGVWDRQYWSKGKTFEEMKEELGESSVEVEIVDKAKIGVEASFSNVQKYAADILRRKPDMGLPADVDPLHKEMHLVPEEFKLLFGMTYEEFQKLPKWKQLAFKKKTDLF
ncbi:advillin-like [Lingula anatina]|uniref:Advillin-like n=1 Tax=Lingula anatina TaxID=7574 RepID=A0A1S3H0Q1_LINAN|nr:advillin-like [Lingula anatina]XP_013379709.1 advillin-like [Lingula anatina]XP_013379710.1 advillin-like [Lingula anatina]XP_013379711.1 advillin-like [Lingula anatina]|eukprot:XP_013379708.1 advillin-like [Lingula anatina]